MPVQHTCSRCGRSFKRPPSGASIFCSFSCYVQSPPLADRFAASIDRCGPLPSSHPEFGNCWLWTGKLAPSGYGTITLNPGQGTGYAHHLAWELIAGPAPDGLWRLHTCDVRHCVRNDAIGTYEVGGKIFKRRGHLWLGANTDNMRDMAEKKRCGFQVHPDRARRGDNHPVRLRPELVMRGAQNPRSKLTEEQVRAILQRYRTGDVTQTALAIEYGVTQGLIWRIVHKKMWQHITT